MCTGDRFVCVHRNNDIHKFHEKLINILCARRVQKSQRNGMASATHERPRPRTIMREIWFQTTLTWETPSITFFQRMQWNKMPHISDQMYCFTCWVVMTLSSLLDWGWITKTSFISTHANKMPSNSVSQDTTSTGLWCIYNTKIGTGLSKHARP